VTHTFVRFALPMNCDFCELATSNDVGGAYPAQLVWVARVVEATCAATDWSPGSAVKRRSAVQPAHGEMTQQALDAGRDVEPHSVRPRVGRRSMSRASARAVDRSGQRGLRRRAGRSPARPRHARVCERGVG
jgi:hypothetical protein